MTATRQQPGQELAPLAERMRPRTLEECAGQEHLTGPDCLLPRLLAAGRLPSLILWGPPGCGKTTLAGILARGVRAEFVFFSAVLSGVKEIRAITAKAEERRLQGLATILFVDEIHRFNKAQQDALLPHVESGRITLIGATTENPSFEVIAPLLSRCRLLTLKPLEPVHLVRILERALAAPHGLGESGQRAAPGVLETMARLADGDARRALGLLETCAALAGEEGGGEITAEHVRAATQGQGLRYDKNGEEHYNLISALHKSLRDSDPDGALYWLYRMLAAGEDPLYIARRLVRFASEDVGLADPSALNQAIACREAYHLLGSPEGELALAQATAYLATAPKSNALYMAEKAVLRDVREHGSLGVPLHLRNAPTKLMRGLGYGRGYQYAHDEPDALTPQEHLPPELADRTYYHPTSRGYEAVVGDRLAKWRKILEEKRLARQAGSPAPRGPGGQDKAERAKE